MVYFRMPSIHVNPFAILCDSIGDRYNNIDLECGLGFHASEQCVSVSVKVMYTSTEPLMVIETICQFSIDEDSWNELVQTNGEVLLPKEFLAHLAMHTVGTVRGVLHCKTEGTQLNFLILPPINVLEMIQNDLLLPIDKA